MKKAKTTSPIYKAMQIDGKAWICFTEYGAYCDEKGIVCEPKRFTRDCGYEIDNNTIEALA